MIATLSFHTQGKNWRLADRPLVEKDDNQCYRTKSTISQPLQAKQNHLSRRWRPASLKTFIYFDSPFGEKAFGPQRRYLYAQDKNPFMSPQESPKNSFKK